MVKSFSVNELLTMLGCTYKVVGIQDAFVRSFDPIHASTASSLAWVRAEGAEGSREISSSLAPVVICGQVDVERVDLEKRTLIIVDNPQLTFLRVVKGCVESNAKRRDVIHETAIVSPLATLAEGVSIGPYAVIGACEIGTNSSIGSHSVIHDGVVIGNNVIISEFCNVGSNGFSYVRNESGNWENMPHIGRVVIEDDVDVLSFTNIGRATLGETRIGHGSKLDHHCHIAHNSTLGARVLVAAGVVVAGGTHIGDDSALWIGSTIRDNLRIGREAVVGQSAAVAGNIRTRETWVGNPARRVPNFDENQ